VGQFIASCKKYGVKPGFYYSLSTNSYLNVLGGRVLSSPLTPGQVNVTQKQYEYIVYQQLRELWTLYGDMFEIWFDGGYVGDEEHDISRLTQLQPHTVFFNGFGIAASNARWVGTESGHAPDPNWSTADNDVCLLGGPGDADLAFWCPSEIDSTMQNGDNWFYDPNVGVHTLEELISMYHDSVGHNGNWVLDLAPTSDGLLPDEAVERYKQVGDFIRNCYSVPLFWTSGMGTQLTLNFGANVTFDRIVLREDISLGHRIRVYTVLDFSGSIVSRGTAIGNKKIDLLPTPVTLSGIQLNVVVNALNPSVTFFGVFMCS